MKFEQRYPESKAMDKFGFENSYVIKHGRLGQCFICGAFTRWIDGAVQKPVCSEECCTELWKHNKGFESLRHKQPELVIKSSELELAIASITEPVWKDIIIIVHDQLSYFKECIESIRANTANYTLYIWDNASGPETKKYIEELQEEHFATNPDDWDIEVWTVENNQGFIVPNNNLAAMGTSEYIILLNSDTKVFKHWDMAMIGWLKQNADVAQVGYWGGHLKEDGVGGCGDYGYDIDYVAGWCFCISRETYTKHGLFDQDNLKFAYCEDADFSMRLLESGKKLYALHAPLVYHHQNKTIQTVKDEGEVDVRETFDHNHQYIRRRWRQYLDTGRVFARSPADND